MKGANMKPDLSHLEGYFGEFFDEYIQQVTEMLDKYNWSTIEAYMDPEICEQLHIQLAPCSSEVFSFTI